MGRGGESGSHSGDSGEAGRAEESIGRGRGLKVERDRGAIGMVESMSSRWCERSRWVESRFECWT